MFRHSWRTQLKGAASETDLLAVVRGFMSEWSRREVDTLPAGAWPSRILTIADVVSHSVALAGLHARFQGGAVQLKLVQELVLFFTQAAVRAVQLREAQAAADWPASGHRMARAKTKPRQEGRARKRAH